MNLSKTGFSETLIQKPNSSNKIIPITEENKKNICKEILYVGKKINNKYSIPSQFPVITGTLSNKKTGGRKKRKTLRKKSRK